MNTMATSLHTPTEDSFSELMKSDSNVDTSGLGVAGGDDLDMDADDFDADELLQSPLFNDSAEKLVDEEEAFGNFGTNEENNGSNNDPGLSQGNMGAGDGGGKREFVPMGLRRSDDTDLVKHRQVQQTYMPQQAQSSYGMGDGGGVDMMYSTMNANNHMGQNYGGSFMDQQQQQHQQQQQQQRQQQQRQQQQYQNGSGSMDTSGRYQGNNGMDTSQNNASNNMQQNNMGAHNGMNSSQFNSFGGGNQMMDNNNTTQGDYGQPDNGMNMMGNPYLNQGNNSNSGNNFFRNTPERSSSSTSSFSSDNSPAPRAPGSLLDMSPGSNGMSGQGPNMMRRAAPQRSKTYHSGAHSSAQSGMYANPLQMMQQRQQLQQQQLQQNGGNQLEGMKQHLQQMQELEQLEHHIQQQSGMDTSNNNAPGMGLSQSMHVPSRSVSCGPDGLGANGYGNSGFNQGGMGNNNQVAMGNNNQGGMESMSDLEAMQNHLSGSGNSNGGGGNGGVSVNDAMEKLCESMKRSAMSRTLVKQFSSGPRGVSRSNSGAMVGLGRDLSGRGVRRTSSRSGIQMDDGSHRSIENRPAAPIRRISNAKHQFQRGVFRHASANMVGVNQNNNHQQGNNNHHSNFQFQIDGRNLGSL